MSSARVKILRDTFLRIRHTLRAHPSKEEIGVLSSSMSVAPLSGWWLSYRLLISIEPCGFHPFRSQVSAQSEAHAPHWVRVRNSSPDCSLLPFLSRLLPRSLPSPGTPSTPCLTTPIHTPTVPSL